MQWGYVSILYECQRKWKTQWNKQNERVLSTGTKDSRNSKTQWLRSSITLINFAFSFALWLRIILLANRDVQENTAKRVVLFTPLPFSERLLLPWIFKPVPPCQSLTSVRHLACSSSDPCFPVVQYVEVVAWCAERVRFRWFRHYRLAALEIFIASLRVSSFLDGVGVSVCEC